MIHDVIEIDGIEYKAVSTNSCEGCSFDRTRNCNNSVKCCNDERIDNTNVAYKRHYKLVRPDNG